MPASSTPIQRPVILDVAGHYLSPADRRRLRHPLTGGVILFSRNWRDSHQMDELTCEIKEERPDILVCVDHEGGDVQRFRSGGFTQLPAMARLGALYAADGPGLYTGPSAMRAMDAAVAVGYVLASELRAVGVDFSFTPVLDIGHGTSRVIGDRAFHADPSVVSVLANCLMHGLARAGMRSCGKHFPGHGFVAADSHVDIPVDSRPLSDLLAHDALPYRWLASSLDAVMPAHVVYSDVDPLPAAFSPYWLKDVLRNRLRFSGAVVCDDLSMQGAAAAGSPVEAAVKALNAGCDLLLLCNQAPVDDGAPVDALLDGLADAAEKRLWAPDARSETRRLNLLPFDVPLAWPALNAHLPYQAALATISEVFGE